jgi:hypothetical protein
MIKWDTATRLYVIIHSQWRNKMQGICGNFDQDATNDYMTIGGIVSTVKELFESWRVEDSCPLSESPMIDESDPCHNHLHRKEWATKECSLITTRGSDNPFTPCLDKLDVNDLHKSHTECLFDACSCDRGGDCECLCSSLASFAELCNKVGVSIKWRSQHRCPIQCEYGKEYLPCGPICQQTCMDLSTGNNPECSDAGCVEGCFCPAGTVQDYDGKCIQPGQCDCNLDNNRYPAGSEITKDCQLCTCTNGSFDCSQNLTDCRLACNNQTEFTCSADKTCLPKEWICDKVNDCSDGSDELDCKCDENNSTFVCESGQCIRSEYLCDGVPNCRDGSDESECNQKNCEEFECKETGTCIPLTWLCDGHPDCGEMLVIFFL